MSKFRTPYDQYKEYNGQTCYVIRELNDTENPDKKDVGSLFLIKLNSGVEIIAWPEEIHE